MDLQLTNKTALVTGSTAGIGFAIASLFAQEGAAVVVNGRSPRQQPLLGRRGRLLRSRFRQLSRSQEQFCWSVAGPCSGHLIRIRTCHPLSRSLKDKHCPAYETPRMIESAKFHSYEPGTGVSFPGLPRNCAAILCRHL